MTWLETRRNLWPDPRAHHALDAALYSSGPTHALSQWTSGTGTPWVRSTRLTPGQAILFALKFPVPPGVDYRLRLRIQAPTWSEVVEVWAVPDVRVYSQAGKRLGTFALPIGDTIMDVIGGYTSSTLPMPGFQIRQITNLDLPGTPFDIREILVEKAPSQFRYFDGSYPDITDPIPVRYSWAGVEDYSESVQEADLADDEVPPDWVSDPGPQRYVPTIKVLGRSIPCEFTWRGENAVVMDGIEIEWGRDALYDQTNPSELRFDLIDPTGRLASDPALFGAPITVETAFGIMFRGRIDALSLEPYPINDVNPNVPKDGWLVKVSATDVIAELAKLVVPERVGPDNGWTLGPYNDDHYGEGYWRSGDAEERRASVQARAAEHGIATKIYTKDFATMTPPGLSWDTYFWEGIERSGSDLFTLAQAVMLRGNRPLAVNYRPEPDVLEPVDWPPAALLILFYDTERTSIEIRADAGANETFTVDCSTVAVADPGAVESTVTHNIASIRVDELQGHDEPQTEPPLIIMLSVYEDASVEYAIDAPGGGTAQYQPPVKPGRKGSSTSYQHGVAFAELLAPYVTAVNGRLVPPEFIFDIENERYGRRLEETLLSTWAVPIPWAFPGSKYDLLSGFGPVFQHIGGSLIYRQGWEVRARFAPSPVADTTELAINQLVTSDIPTFDQYAPNVMLVSLGGVSRGVN